jgi:hypothetical protein
MKLDHQTVLTVGAAILFGLVGCEKHESSDQTHTTGATISQPVGRDLNDGTIDRLAEARCKRATACDDILNGKEWNDEPTCERVVRAKIFDEYKQNACHTVLSDKVTACVQAIHTEPCDSAFDIGRIDACRKDVLCKE